jgi:hypothetical protein
MRGDQRLDGPVKVLSLPAKEWVQTRMFRSVPVGRERSETDLFVQDDVVGVAVELFVRELVGLKVLDLLDGCRESVRLLLDRHFQHRL